MLHRHKRVLGALKLTYVGMRMLGTCKISRLSERPAPCDTSYALQVLQLTLAGLYSLVALSAAAGWLPGACFGALCLASPVVSACHAWVLFLSCVVLL